MKFHFIAEYRNEFPVVKMCQVLEVSTSGFYNWVKAPVSARELETLQLKKEIKRLFFEEHHEMAGSPIIHQDLLEIPQWHSLSKNRVARLMRDMGLRSRQKRKFTTTTDSKHNEPIAPNILDRNFTQETPDTVWVTDITYVMVGQKWHYLTVFIDLYSRLIVGWDFSKSLDRTSVIAAFGKAWWKRKPHKGLLVLNPRYLTDQSTQSDRPIFNFHFTCI